MVVSLSREDRTYRKLKGVRSEIKKQIRVIRRTLSENRLNELGRLEEQLNGLTKAKTRLRKEFEKLTGTRGPYSS
ncbi:MAG: hypothetical protein QXQ28_01760 [Candidatus Nezhaarchaeales archaeon]